MLARERVTLLDLPTAFWHELVTYLGEERAALPASVRAVIIGGEAVRPARLAEWRTLDTSHIRLVNTYGATETTLVTHAIDLHGPLAEPSERDDTEPVPIGRCLPHVTEHIGEGGELHRRWTGGRARLPRAAGSRALRASRCSTSATVRAAISER